METKQLETRVNFKGKGKEYFGIWIVNILLYPFNLKMQVSKSENYP
nr:DUF898 domain-containing protein [Vibrio lentus]